MPRITSMPDEILLNISQSLHSTAPVCLSVTCSKMQAFFHQPAASMPSLTTTVDCPATLENHEKFLWELLETYLGPRSWGGHYGVDKFVNKGLYQEVRDEYWRLRPQRPYNVEDPSPWVKEGHDVADARGQVKALEEMSPSEIMGPLLHLIQPFWTTRMHLAPTAQWMLLRGGDPHDLVAIV
ncbi:uncharacterized protein K444DRAFT_386726 [Hyaloscypha bicolor E]|uniref:F-box domain-containing protein n=1 Tax=Hyaloscypha bicolor E TaxID=1095630 RepID=A0A2J6TC65_9HELO|nr:uncharacterized protein K444DRAFT_386726 [Hyaloscypha bicolor E]PMD60619.1 hypothetical protein K444DRAFT_386726 [Hyaloscypha bicolor E]